MSTIDFSKLSDRDLLDSIIRIDKIRFSANYEAAVAEINKRGLSQTILEPFVIDPNLPRPWLRFWAKTFDSMIIILFYTIIYSLITREMESTTFSSSIGMWILFCLYECIIIHLTGTTLGKSTFGISVKTKSGQLPKLKDSLNRSLNCWIWGEGLGYFAPITNIISYFKLMSSGTTKWDNSSGTVVQTKGVSVGKLFFMFIGIAGLIFLIFIIFTKFEDQSGMSILI